ncbi:unnamed protein product [Penicillium nalgiovense]|uniref:KOW domain-containing protein n=1 Tax=Penicillium nalgiovense TaxID=60175 RepID=A0A9W4HD20_PENNA|nr:unnamed protein product [Penicillium nalgiovense]CAG7958849.1 unnamed protein product [Penicillium nalgiovense]CAG7959915.1 unnamed protein product [Penicillium nalgiovense]CAG7963061.1 unnamed protein product [Penicillium nalgiovense]CAG7974661.1 unnamed protein product [Penicillium nalgiovense]
MQRVIQRTATARRQALKKSQKAHERQELLERVSIRRARKDFGNALSSQFQAARKNRWEDWEKGPLAPMRDSGLQRTTYGGQEASILHPPRLPKQEQRRHVLFAEGDRVCVVRGWDEGKIDVIQQVNRDSETVLIKEINMADVIIPEWAKDRMGHAGDTQPQPFPVSFDDIRHVIPLEDTKTGKLQNVVVQHAYAAGPYHDRGEHSKLPKYTRYVSGLDIEIPWPLEDEPVITDGDMDTTRMAVEVSTFTPTLEQPPMPSTVIDELRNKYSRFRTRHDPEYLREKMREDYRKEYRNTVSMMTPQTDAKNMRIARLAEARKANFDAEGNGILSPDAINFINSHLQNATKTKKSKSKQAA